MNWIRLAVLAALCTTLLYGCEDDRNDSLAGTWITSGIKAMKADGTIAERATAPVWTELLTFNEDGTFTYRSTYNSSVRTGSGTWTVQDGLLRFSGAEKAYPCTIDGNELTLFGNTASASYRLRLTRQ